MSDSPNELSRKRTKGADDRRRKENDDDSFPVFRSSQRKKKKREERRWTGNERKKKRKRRKRFMIIIMILRWCCWCSSWSSFCWLWWHEKEEMRIREIMTAASQLDSHSQCQEESKMEIQEQSREQAEYLFYISSNSLFFLRVINESKAGREDDSITLTLHRKWWIRLWIGWIRCAKRRITRQSLHETMKISRHGSIITAWLREDNMVLFTTS